MARRKNGLSWSRKKNIKLFLQKFLYSTLPITALKGKKKTRKNLKKFFLAKVNKKGSWRRYTKGNSLGSYTYPTKKNEKNLPGLRKSIIIKKELFHSVTKKRNGFMKEKKLKSLKKLLEFLKHPSLKKNKKGASMVKRQRKKKIKNLIFDINKLDAYSIYHISKFLQRGKNKYTKATRKGLIAKIKKSWYPAENIQNKSEMMKLLELKRKSGRLDDELKRKNTFSIRNKNKNKKSLLYLKKKRYNKKLRINKKLMFLGCKKKIPFFFHNRLYSLYFY